ncbi:MAG: protein adenylyltransferase SelO family protein, partial [Burkholderiales bacterium]
HHMGDLLTAGMNRYDAAFDLATRNNLVGKFGFAEWREEDAVLVNDAYRLLADAEVDMTIFFRRLADIGIAPNDVAVDRATIADAFYRDDMREAHLGAFDAWLARYRGRIAVDDLVPSDRAERMARFNPKYVLRNYLAQEAIDLATAGDNSMVLELLDVMRRPYIEQPSRERFAEKRPDWARQKAGCSMLSCSS